MRIDSPDFLNAFHRYQELSAIEDEVKVEKKQIQEYILNTFSEYDLTTDAKGTEKLLDANGEGFVVTHKLTTKVDPEKAMEACAKFGKNPDELYSVKLELSEKKLQSLSKDEQDAVRDSLITKRATSSFTLKLNMED